MFKRRLAILFGLLLLAGGVVTGRLAQVQLLWDEMFRPELYRRAGGNRVVDTVRGGIFTRWGTPLAQQVPTFAVGVLYDELSSDGWTRTVSRLTDTPVAELTERAAEIIRRVERIQRAVQRRSGYDPEENYIRVVEQNQHHVVVGDVGAEAAAAVRAEPDRFPGIRVMQRTRREYTNGTLAPHIVGSAGKLSAEKWERLEEEDRVWTMNRPVSEIGRRYMMDDRSGVTGIEKEYEDLLRGRRGYEVNRLRFRVLDVEKETERIPPEPGCDVYLTVREDFQRAANRALARAAGDEALDFQQGALVIMDVRSGAVLACATYPSYSPDDVGAATEDPRSPLLFRPLQGLYQTGSVYKIITAIAALQEGAITSATTFDCTGKKRYGDRYWRCTGWHRHISLVRAIEKSCNIYFYNVGLKVGGDALADWGRRLGLGRPTGVDWPYERTGHVPDADAMFQVLNLSIGQGRLLATPLQVANAMAAVANGGRVYAPHFLDHAVDASGRVVKRAPREYRAVDMRAGVLDAVRQGMRRVVDTGTASEAGLGGFRAAGKTGTAELGDSGLNHAWFAGFAPYEDPKIAFAVVNERVEGGHGGTHAAPILAFALEEIWPEVEAMP